MALKTCNTQYVSATILQPVSLWANQSSVVRIKARVEYITRYPTAYSDRECWAWASCGLNEYALQSPVDDENGFLLKRQICRPATICLSGVEYTKVNGKATGDRNNVCMRYTTCKADKEYMLVDKTSVSDRVCVAYTECDNTTEYLLRRGNATSDNVCTRKTFCAAESYRSMYELRPPVHSVAWNVLGKDAVCAPVSTCPAGKYVYQRPTDTSNVVCELCPKGMYSQRDRGVNDSMANVMYGGCEVCPAGKYSDVLGATSCKTCTDCLARNMSCPYTNRSLCRNAYEKLCAKDADANCISCPVEAKGWEMDRWGVCKLDQCILGTC